MPARRYQVDVPSAAAIKRIAPGQKDLSTAETIQFSDLAVGDRVLVKLDPDAPAGTTQALQIVAIKQADLAQKQQKDREDWQRRGVGGLVKSVDAAAGVIVLTSGVGSHGQDDHGSHHQGDDAQALCARHRCASMRRSPRPSTQFILATNCVRAAQRMPDGTSIAAEEVVSGTFRNISGAISSLDTAGSTLVVKDLATKKQVTIHITPDAQMRRLPDRMAHHAGGAAEGNCRRHWRSFARERTVGHGRRRFAPARRHGPMERRWRARSRHRRRTAGKAAVVRAAAIRSRCSAVRRPFRLPISKRAMQ